MLVTLLPMVTEGKLVQLVNALVPMLSTLSGMVTAVFKPEQNANAVLPMLFRPLPRVTEVRPVQLLNALSPMLSTALGMVTDDRFEQP